MKITFIVMGEEHIMDVPERMPVFVARWRALAETYNIGRPPSDFEIRTYEGEYVDPLTYVKDIPKGPVYLTPAMGAGG